jgi:glycosyltransferase involved in cell wall biosynthesis
MEGLSTHRETRREHHRERERLYLRFFPRKYVYRRYRDIKRSLNRALGSRPRRKPQRHDADPLEHSSPRIGLCPYPKRDNWHKYGNPHLHRIVEGLEKRGLGVIGVRADELRSPDACAKDKGLSAFYLHWATSCYDLDSYKHVGVPAGVDRVLRRIPGLRKMYRALQEPYTTAVDRVFGNAVARSGTRRIRAWCNDLHRCTVPVVWHQHDLRSHNLKGSTTFLSKLDHELHQRLYQACDAIVAHEQSSLDTVWQHYGARKRYVVAPLGPMIELPPVPRHEARRRLEVPSRATLFLYAGTSRQNRNPATAARAISRVRGSHGDVLLIIAGKNALNYLEAWDVDAVRVLEGFRTQDEMRDLFCAADFLVQDARDYLTSAVIRSALSYGLPVVARNEGSTKDMAAGALVEIGETGLEDAIERCLQLAPEELQSLRRQALARHKERTWQRSTNAIADLFFSMMDAESCSRSGAEVTE